MERGMFFTLLLSGLCCFSSPHVYRQYKFINEKMTWYEARHYCREKYTDLATVESKEDMKQLTDLVNGLSPGVWLGLYNSWDWSVFHQDDYKEGEAAYWNWASGEPRGSHFCGTIGVMGKWHAANCSLSYSFLCYDGSATEISERFILVTSPRNWIQAQNYCRSQFTNLARVRNQMENQELLKMATNGLVWIGLSGKFWAWSDGSKSLYRYWKSKQPEKNGIKGCVEVQYQEDSLGMRDRYCTDEMPFFCHMLPVKKRLVRLKLTSDDSSVDLRDPAVMEAILKQVDVKLRDEGVSKDLNLSWSKHPEKESNRKAT